jgi:hypothetical protein
VGIFTVIKKISLIFQAIEQRMENAGTLLKSNPGSKMIPLVLTTPYKVYFTDVISFKLVLHRPSGVQLGKKTNQAFLPLL